MHYPAHMKGPTEMLIYSSIVARLVRKTFENVQNHNYDEVLKGISSTNLTHRFAGLMHWVESGTTKKHFFAGFKEWEPYCHI
jgi:hypothetical protein